MLKSRIFQFWMLLSLMLTGVVAFSQTGTIKGKVIDKVSNEAIPFASVMVQGTSKGASTDEGGTYRIEGLSPGQYNLEATVVGYKKQVQFEVQVTNAREAIADFALTEETAQLEAVEVEASSTFFKPDESPLSVRTIGTTEIKRTPGGNRDISKVVRSLPGVSSPPSFRNDIIIRGGAPSENTFYLDGIQIPVINHFQTQGSSGGPVGIINVDLLKEVNFYSGAFPANRGNTLSSVFDFTLKDGRDDKWTFNGVVGATDFGATFEGPVSSNSTLVLSARRSYLKTLFSIFNLPFLPVYNDLQFKYKIRLGEKSKLTVLGLAAIDDFELNFDAPSNAGTADEKEQAEYLLRVLPVSTQWNYTAGLKYEFFRPNGTTSLFLSTNKLNNDVIKYRNNDDSNESDLIQDYNSKETEYRLRVEDYFLSDGLRVNYGLNGEYVTYDTKEFFRVVTGQGIMVRDYDSELGFYKWGAFGQISRNYLGDQLTLSFGVRADANNYSGEMNSLTDQLSPRLSASYAVSPSFNLNFNTGIYYQLPPYTVLGFRDNGSRELINKRNKVKYIRSKHIVAGVEFNLKRNSRITLESFYKYYDRYPFLLDDSISLANLGADFGTIGNAPVRSISEGRSYGAEFLFQQKLFDGYYGLFSYTWVRSQFEDRSGDLIPSAWDNKHLISMTGGKRFARNWEVGVRFLFSGGSPYTPYDLSETLRKQNWDIRSFGVYDYDRLNSERIGAYHQLDLRVDKKYFFRKWSVDLYLDVQNVYNFTTKFQDDIDIQRNENGEPLTDPSNPEFYLPNFIESSYGSILPTIGIIIEL